MKSAGVALLLFGAFVASAGGQSEGGYLTDPGLDGLSQTKARKFDDFVGRTVLIEFFAYW